VITKEDERSNDDLCSVDDGVGTEETGASGNKQDVDFKGVESDDTIRVLLALLSQNCGRLEQDASSTDATAPRLLSGPDPDMRRVQAFDIFCDRNDESAPGHYGNRKLGLVVSTCTKRYSNLHIPKERAKVARIIVQTVRNCEPGGRFLAKTKRGTWKDIGDRLAVRWVGLVIKKAAGPQNLKG